MYIGSFQLWEGKAAQLNSIFRDIQFMVCLEMSSMKYKGSQTQSKDLKKNSGLWERLMYVKWLQFLLSFIMMDFFGCVFVYFFSIFSKPSYLEHCRHQQICLYNEMARFNSYTQCIWNPQQHTSHKCTSDVWPGEQLVINGSHLNWIIHIVKNYVLFKDHR